MKTFANFNDDGTVDIYDSFRRKWIVGTRRVPASLWSELSLKEREQIILHFREQWERERIREMAYTLAKPGRVDECAGMLRECIALVRRAQNAKLSGALETLRFYCRRGVKAYDEVLSLREFLDRARTQRLSQR